MDLSLIQKDILITLIALYHQKSSAIKGEDIADVLKRNAGTVRNQMQALKALELVEGVPGPKGGYTPTSQAYEILNLETYREESDVPIRRANETLKGINVAEIDFTTLCHPDLCHAVVKLIGSVKGFEIGDEISIGPTPVNRLFIRGKVYGKDERDQYLLITISELISLPKRDISHYMSSPVHTLRTDDTFLSGIHLFSTYRINGAPVMDGAHLSGIVTLFDIARGIDEGLSLDTPLKKVMTTNVETIAPHEDLYEVINRFSEHDIGRLVVVEDNLPVGILTHSDVLRVFPMF